MQYVRTGKITKGLRYSNIYLFQQKGKLLGETVADGRWTVGK